MCIFKEKNKKTLFKILIFMSMATNTLISGNIIINKSYISPNSISTGNNGIIINGKSQSFDTKMNKKLKYHHITIPCSTKNFTIKCDNANIKIAQKSDKKCSVTLPNILKEDILNKKQLLKISKLANKDYNNINIMLNIKKIETLKIKGDSTIELNKTIKDKLSLDLKGDSVITTFNYINLLDLKIIGDATINIKQKINKAEINYLGDIILTIDSRINDLYIKGSGDVNIVSKYKDIHLHRSIDGDLNILTKGDL